jgi:hypothetical protein
MLKLSLRARCTISAIALALCALAVANCYVFDLRIFAPVKKDLLFVGFLLLFIGATFFGPTHSEMQRFRERGD